MLKRNVILAIPVSMGILEVSIRIPDHNRGTFGYAGYDSAIGLPIMFKHRFIPYSQVESFMGALCLSHQSVGNIGMAKDITAQRSETGL